MADTPDPSAVETVMRVQRDHTIVAVGRMGYGCIRSACRVTGTRCDVEDHVAREVVAALGLTEDRRTLADGMGGQVTSREGFMRFITKPNTVQRRYVTPWQEVP